MLSCCHLLLSTSVVKLSSTSDHLGASSVYADWELDCLSCISAEQLRMEQDSNNTMVASYIIPL